jgi:hypothetical protein
MHNGQLHRLLGDIVDAAGTGRLRACDLSTYPGRALRRERSRACLRDAIRSVGLQARFGGMPARRGRKATHQFAAAAGYRFPIIEGREFAPYSDVNRLAAPLCAPAGLSAGRDCPSVLSYPGKSCPGKSHSCRVCASVRVGHDVLCRFFRRISIRNDTVVVESTSATAAEKGSRENRGVPRNAAAAANHIFTVFPIEALNIQ